MKVVRAGVTWGTYLKPASMYYTTLGNLFLSTEYIYTGKPKTLTQYCTGEPRTLAQYCKGKFRTLQLVQYCSGEPKILAGHAMQYCMGLLKPLAIKNRTDNVLAHKCKQNSLSPLTTT